MVGQAPTPKPEFEQLLNRLKKDLEELKKSGVVPTLAPAEEAKILIQLVVNLLSLKQHNKPQFENLLNNKTNKDFLLFAHFRPEFKDMALNGQLLEVLTTPQNELSLRLFAHFRLALNNCLTNLKKLNPEAEKLHREFLEQLNMLEKTREQGKSNAPLCENPIFKEMVDPLIAFFRMYFGQDIRIAGSSVTANAGAIISTANVNTATLDQGPGETAAEEAILGGPNTPVDTDKEIAAAAALPSSMKPPWMKTTLKKDSE